MAAEKSLSPVRIHSNLQVWTDDKLRLPELRNKATAAIAKMNLKPRENTRDAAFLFFAGIPGNSPAASRADTSARWQPIPIRAQIDPATRRGSASRREPPDELACDEPYIAPHRFSHHGNIRLRCGFSRKVWNPP